MKKLFFNPSLLLFFFCISSKISTSQCVNYKVEMEQKVSAAKYIVLGEVIEKQTYIDNTGGVNTLNKLKVNAWLKGDRNASEVFVITLGGVYGNKATIVTPSLQLRKKQEYVLMLEDDNRQVDDKNFRQQHPQELQLLTYADQQGCFTNNNNSYRSLFISEPKSERDLFDEIRALTGKVAKKPSGEIFQTREPVIVLNRLNTVTGFSPSSTHGGTIVPGDFITITGSGFGTTPGNIFFTDADDGGMSMSASGVASDIVSWADGSITVKVPGFAGTGPIDVNGSDPSATNLTTDYNHIEINNDFFNFSEVTRQRYYLRDMNMLGGYTFTFNDNFITNTPAVAAFKRAVVTWRCNTFVNWRLDQASSSNTFGDDDVNIVIFDALPAGVLGRATSRFDASASGLCDMENTVWCASEIDIQFSDPPFTGFTWEYGTALPSGSEFDFESVVLHELGHAHGLGHVISAGEVMHYALSNGAALRTLSAGDIAGGVAKLGYSTSATCLDPADCGSGPMVALDAMSCTALPVELTVFNGERISTAVNKLYWNTAQEINSYGFYVQRSRDGSDFEELGFIRSSGNSVVPLNYNFPDNTAGPYPWFYRLRMVDIDGRQNFSNTIFIDGDKTVKWKVWSGSNGDRIYLYGNVPANEGAVIKVFSSTGQQVISRKIQSGSDEIAVDHFAKGIYHYQLFYKGTIITGKLLLGNR